MRLIDLSNSRHGRLIVINRAPGVDSCGNALWNCVCDCGGKVVVISRLLRHGATRSCGCLSREVRSITHATHKMYGTPEHRSWRSMLARCRSPSGKRNRRYGGRGILVCERWLSFGAFLEDMGKKPSPKMQIDRIDINGNYEPGNCRWATQKQQMRNTARSRFIEYNGQRLCVSEWAEVFDVRPGLIRLRLSRGWSIERALTEKVED